MQKISDIKISLKGRPNSERAYWIQQLADLMGIDFKKVLGFTIRMTPKEIQEIYDTAKGWKVNSPALARKLIREKNQQINKQLCKN